MVYTLGIYYLGLRPLGRISGFMGNHLKAPLNIPDSLTLGTSVWPLPGWRKELAIQTPHQIFFLFPNKGWRDCCLRVGWEGENQRNALQLDFCSASYPEPPVPTPILADLRNIWFSRVKVIVIAVIPESCLPLCLITVQHNNHYVYH